MRKLLPAVLSGAVAVSFSTLVFAQSTTTTDATKERKDNIHYNIHQRGDQSSSQIGSGNQSSQISGSGNAATQQSSQDSTWSEKNAQNRQSADASASAGASADDDEERKNKSKQNKGWHKGWDDPASSGSTKY